MSYWELLDKTVYTYRDIIQTAHLGATTAQVTEVGDQSGQTKKRERQNNTAQRGGDAIQRKQE